VNLPTHEHGQKLSFRYCTWKNNPHLAGTRAFFREDRDRAWGFDAAFTYGGRLALYRPDGQKAVEMLVDHHTNKLVRFDVPADRQTGDYTLACVEPSADWNENTNPGENPGLARVIRCDLPMVVQAAVPPQTDPVVGRALYFGVPAGATNAAVVLQGGDPRRECTLREIGGGGDWQVSTRGRVPGQEGTMVLPIPERGKDRRLGLFLATPPDAHFAAGRARPAVLLKNVPPYVAANPQDWFVPEIPAALR
jgi:hypothetical protein